MIISIIIALVIFFWVIPVIFSLLAAFIGFISDSDAGCGGTTIAVIIIAIILGILIFNN